MTNKTVTHEYPDGTQVEYRRRADLAAFALEARVLRPDGTPYADGWYPVSDAHFTDLQQDGTGVVEAMRAAE